jgi:hypothetical protein
MKLLATIALLLIGYSGHSFIHTYIHLAPNFNSCQTELDFAICNETPFTYMMTYNGNPVTALDFPLNGGPSCSNATGNLYFFATNGSDNYEFEVQINFSPTGITIQYLLEPAVRPMTIIQHHQPSTMTCSGEISLTVDGGYLPYQTQWFQNGNPYPSAPGALQINQLCPGQYGYSVSDAYSHCGNNPPIIRNVSIDLFDCMVSTTPMSCPDVCDGSAQLTLIGSNAVSATSVMHFDGQTDPMNLTNLCAGVATGFAIHLSGAYANCMPGTVTEPIEPSYDLALTHVTGFGLSNGSAEVTITSGTGPFSYHWQGENTDESGDSFIDNLTAGNYTLTIGYNSGCELSIDFEISEPPQLQINIIEVQNQTGAAPNGMISYEITGGVEPYVFFLNDIETTNNGLVSDLPAGTYILKVFDDNLNEAEIAVEIKNTASLITSSQEIKVYPNPTSHSVNIQTQETMHSIAIIGLNGKIILSQSVEHPTYCQIDVSCLDSGLYFISIEYMNGKKSITELVKQ